jgi:hypothetical protein
MTFKNCITDGVTEGAISQDQANEVLGLFDELETQYNRQMGGAAASAKAAGDTTIAMKKMAIERKRRWHCKPKPGRAYRMTWQTIAMAWARTTKAQLRYR